MARRQASTSSPVHTKEKSPRMEITYDRHSYMLDGRRIWLMSGAMHYFRVPAALWRDRLLKARAAGLNCIETYVAWNFHEPREGEWHFEGDHDVAAFVRLAGELGLYVILRPGPYICAEWDFGGFPAWLTTKPGIFYRSDEPVYTHYYTQYLNQVLPRLAPLQVTHGGPIVLIQNENEYYMSSYPGCEAYLQNLNQLFHANGFTIPIINCNRFSNTPAAGTIECINTWGTEIQDIKRMRNRQPDAPLLVTEFWAGGFDTWGWPHRARDARDTARRMLEMLGCGAQLNPYMWHGGTNFGFWGSRLIGDQAFYQCTSYDMDAALAEGGGLTRKYYLSRLVTMLGSTMGRWFSEVELAAPAVHLHDTLATLKLTGPLGAWVTVTNHGHDAAASARVSLAHGRELAVRLDHMGAVMLPINLKLAPGLVLDYANVMPLGWFNEHMLVLHGPPGAAVEVSLNGEVIADSIPMTESVARISREACTLLLMPSALAERCWWVRDRLLIGPSEVPGTMGHAEGWPADAIARVSAEDYADVEPCWSVGPQGKLRAHRMAARRLPAPPPKLERWTCLGRAEELQRPASALEWQPLAGPADFDTLGNYYGYGWYRLELEQATAGTRRVFLPDCADRATLFINGQRAGTWGGGPGAVRAPLGIKLRRGANSLVLLLDNLGRFSHTDKMGELKGLYGHIYTARRVRVPRPVVRRRTTFAPALIPAHQWHRVAESSTWRTLNDEPVWSVTYTISLESTQPLHLSFRDVPHNVAVLVNGKQVAFYPFYAPTFGDLTLSSELRRGRNEIEFILWGDVQPNVLKTLRLHTLTENLSAHANWSFRAWQQPPKHVHAARSAAAPLPQAKDHPAWFSTCFARDERNRPLYLSVGRAWKGQIYLNGHNLGRYWNIGPSGTCYLPECWMHRNNTLLVFDEAGRSPSGSRLHLCPQLNAAPHGEQQTSSFFTV
jgi:hypothetical protein